MQFVQVESLCFEVNKHALPKIEGDGESVKAVQLGRRGSSDYFGSLLQ